MAWKGTVHRRGRKSLFCTRDASRCAERGGKRLFFTRDGSRVRSGRTWGKAGKTMVRARPLDTRGCPDTVVQGCGTFNSAATPSSRRTGGPGLCVYLYACTPSQPAHHPSRMHVHLTAFTCMPAHWPGGQLHSCYHIQCPFFWVECLCHLQKRLA